MRFHVLGLSPLGVLIAYHLRASSRSVTLVHKSYRNAWASHNRSRGEISVETGGVIQRCGGFQSEVLEKGEISGVGIAFNPNLTRDQTPNYVPLAEDIHTCPIESLVVTSKPTHTLNALSNMLPRLNASSTVVLLQDGMGIFEELVQKVFRNPETRPNFILASNSNGAWFKGTLHVVHAALGAIDFGIIPDPRRRDFEASLADESKPKYERQLNLDDIMRPGNPSYNRYRSLRETVAALSSIDALGSKWRPMADVQIAMRKKLVISALVDPLTALLGCRNGALFRDRGSEGILRNVCKEASEVFRAQLEYETRSYLDSLAPNTDRNQVPLVRMPPELEAENLMDEVRRISRRQGNISSTLTDIKHGRKTEIQYLNGYLVDLGKKYGVPTPVNATLCDMIHMRSAVPLDQRL
ncbi:ketopantoate reductase PanE/ApbA C terminal-domain-containing protein [Scleroderma citrinum]